MRTLGVIVLVVSLTLALIRFLVAAFQGDKELGSQLFMVGFLVFSCYAVVSGLVVGEGNVENPASRPDGKASLLGFGTIAIGGAVDYFVGLRSELLAFIVILGAVLLALGLTVTVYKAVSKTG